MNIEELKEAVNKSNMDTEAKTEVRDILTLYKQWITRRKR